MKLVQPSFTVENPLDGIQILKNIEAIGRVCYKSEDAITETSAKDFVAMLIRRGHESVLEHEKISVRFICDRGVSHELVRHRLASFSQESTRYCNYSNDKFDGQITFIIPEWIDESQIELVQRMNENNYQKINQTTKTWYALMLNSEQSYKLLLNQGWQPQQARSVLPNSLKTEIVITANLREWRTIFKQRTAVAAHPQMREIMIPLLAYLKERIPVVFDDFN